MITPELINRINELANKQKNSGLTEQEKAEQKQLREKYLQGIREKVKAQLGVTQNDQGEKDQCTCKNNCNSESQNREHS